jgi:hypothetical protein
MLVSSTVKDLTAGSGLVSEDAGELVRIGGVLLSPEGISKEASQQENIPWGEYGGVEVGGHSGTFFVDLFRAEPDGKRNRAFRADVNLLRAWVLPPSIEEYARRYGGLAFHGSGADPI